MPASDGEPRDALAEDAGRALALLAIDPRGLGGVRLGGDDEPRRAWIAALCAALGPAARSRRIPPNVDHGALVGDTDITASLAAGRRVCGDGLLASADGGVVELPPSAETPLVGWQLAAVLDGEPFVTGAGDARRARLLVVAWSNDDFEEAPTAPTALDERLAFRLRLPRRLASSLAPTASDIAAARTRLAQVEVSERVVEAVCRAAARLGIESVRAMLLAVRAARASAALDGRTTAGVTDVQLAARLVLAPRARCDAPADADAPAPAAVNEATGDATPKSDDVTGTGRDDRRPDEASDGRDLSEIVVAAVRAAIPGGLPAVPAMHVSGGGGRRGARAREDRGAARGPLGRVRRGRPRGATRLDVAATLAAAAPWQRARRERAANSAQLIVLGDDLRVRRRRAVPAVTTVVAVDASGSAALQRLAEAKGAVELLLAESYVRRERVALVTFRGRDAEVLLPPTRAVARARRLLAALAGGGGTPLAAGIARTLAVALDARRGGGGRAARWVLLTDGRANVALDGRGGRAAAERDALAMAAAMRASDLPGLVVDISPRGEPLARALAERAGAAHVALPSADAHAVHAAVRRLAPAGARGA